MDTVSARHQERAMPQADGFFAKVAIRVHQRLCGLHGHDSLLHFENGRMSLLCTSCGHESPGWDVKTTPARRHSETATERIVQLPLVGARRAA
jgi:hypothetical protein